MRISIFGLASLVSVLAIGPAAAQRADISLIKFDAPDPVIAGTDLTYTITVSNEGPDDAASAALTDTLAAGTTFVSLLGPAEWSCLTPSAGAGGTVSCSTPVFVVGSAVFTLVVKVGPSVAEGTVLSNTATVSSTTPDPNPGAESGTVETTVATSADLSIANVDTPDPVIAGDNLTYTITITNGGPSSAASVSLTVPLPAGTNFQSLPNPAGFTCITPVAGANGTVSCTNPSMAPSTSVFTLVAQVGSTVPGGTLLDATATVSASTADPNPGGEAATARTTVTNGAAITGQKRVSGSGQPNGFVSYTITLSNTSPIPQGDNPGDELTDVLPPELRLVGASASSGSATADVVGNVVRWNGSIPGNGSVTVVIQAVVQATVAPGTVVSNQATFVFDSDGNGTNDTTGVTDDPQTAATGDATAFTVGPPGDIPALGSTGLALLAVLLVIGGTLLSRRLGSV